MYPPELYPGPMIPSYALPAVGWLWPSDDDDDDVGDNDDNDHLWPTHSGGE